MSAPSEREIATSLDLVFSSYLLFRHADRAAERTTIAGPDLAAISDAVRHNVEQVWARLVTDDEGIRRRWISDRLDWLTRQGVISARLAEELEGRVLRSGPVDRQPGSRGALVALWRLHGLYLLLIQAVDDHLASQQDIRPAIEGLHFQAMAALTGMLGIQPTKAEWRLGQILDQGRGHLDALRRQGKVTESGFQVLMRAMGGSADVVIVGEAESGPPPTGTCPVCGAALEQVRLVYCAACETPHHPECWTYIGVCGMFACGCISAVPRPGAPTSRVDFDLKSLPRSGSNRP